MVVDEGGRTRVHDLLVVLVQHVSHTNFAGGDELDKLAGEDGGIKAGSVAGFEQDGVDVRVADDRAVATATLGVCGVPMTRASIEDLLDEVLFKYFAGLGVHTLKLQLVDPPCGGGFGFAVG